MPANPARPLAVSLIAASLFAAAAIALVVGTTLLFRGEFSDWLWTLNERARRILYPLGDALGVALIALGLATATAAASFLRGKRWAWWFAVVLFVCNGCGDIASVVVIREYARSAVGVAISVVFLACLMRPNVRRYFAAQD